jgi:hypothetical protein
LAKQLWNLDPEVNRMQGLQVEKSKREGRDATVLEMERLGAESASIARERADGYHRYHIDTTETKDRQAIPRRFNVKVGKIGLAKLIIKEAFKYKGNREVMLSRPCTYGVFSSPVGGFAPRPDLCVGCLRCCIQHPEFVKVTHNPAHLALGDSYMTHGHVWTVDEEARKGTVPVRGQGYRGRFGGPGFDMMLTDMSEIVRPSRDGIHGRELIGTSVDIGSKPMHLSFDESGGLIGATSSMFSIQVPFFLDTLPTNVASPLLRSIWARTAVEIDSLAVLPAKSVAEENLDSPNVVPILCSDSAAPPIAEQIRALPKARLFEVNGWNEVAWLEARAAAGSRQVAVRHSYGLGWLESLQNMIGAGVPVVHLVADGHGRGAEGRFIMEMMKEAHMSLIETGTRDSVTLLGSGGIVAADHPPKAIICGLDAVGLDNAALVALQGRPEGEMRDATNIEMVMPKNLDEDWGVQRLKNLFGSWRDQMLEILGAMGVREVRRLRGELGRSMMVDHLETEAFGDIEGFDGFIKTSPAIDGGDV